MNTDILSVMASQRKRQPDGTFAVGKLLTAEEKRERNRIRQTRWSSVHVEHKYEHKQAALRAQAGREKPAVCEIPGCGRTDQIHFDHDHKTKKFRGWICQGCNKALGYVKDDPARLRMLAEYLERASVSQGV